jgi:hypothetical protein
VLFSIVAALSGKELFNYNSSLFVDDDCADGEEDKDIYAQERKMREEAEEKLANIAAERARVEQERLFQERKLEHDIKIQNEYKRRENAKNSTVTFTFDNIIIRELVFSITEKEDFTPFAIDSDGARHIPTNDDYDYGNAKDDEKNGDEELYVNEDLFGDDDDLSV